MCVNMAEGGAAQRAARRPFSHQRAEMAGGRREEEEEEEL